MELIKDSHIFTSVKDAMFSPPSLGRFVYKQDNAQITVWISMKLSGRMRNGSQKSC